MKNTITTIIPFYNSNETIKIMLDSILAGTLVPDEILLVDDGSVDISVQIAKDYSLKYPFIHYLHQEHSGVSAARNLGIKEASSDWLSFLDADDYIEPDMYEQMRDAIEDESLDGCICGYFTHKDGIITSYANETTKTLSSAEMLEAMFNDENVRGFLFTRLFKAQTIRNYCFDSKIAICEDLLFQTRYFADKNRRFACISKPFYHYIQNSSSATASLSMFVNGVFKYKLAYDKIKTMVNADYVEQSYNNILTFSMYTLLISYKHGNHSDDTLKQIRLLQKELKNTHCDHKTKRRIAYELCPILFSHFIK